MRLSASWTGTPPAGFVGARRRRFVPCVLLFLGAVAGVAEAFQPVPPTQLTVHVRQPNGDPVSLATACLAQGSQAGGRLTIQGVAVLTGFPTGAYTLHVIKSNFQTKSQSVNLSGTQELTVTLQPGASTPPAGVNCQVGGAPTTLPPITITSFTVDNLPADFKVTAPPATHLPLRATFDRQPAFFRIVEDSGYTYTTPLQNLQTVSWQQILAPSVQPFILFPLNLARPYGTRVVYLQVGSHPSEDGASQIKSVSVILTPGQFRTSVLTGAALQGFLDRAQQEGYGPLKLKDYRVVDLERNALCPRGTTAVLVNEPTAVPGPVVNLDEVAEFRAFAGPPLMPFWKITDLQVLHDWVHPSASGGWMTPAPDVTSTISVSGSTMVNNPFQPPLQAPERIIRIERTTLYNSKPVACVVGAGPPPPFPVFLSVTVVGPDGRDPREAFSPPGPTAGPATLPPRSIPGGIGPIRP